MPQLRCYGRRSIIFARAAAAPSFALAGRLLLRGMNMHRLAACGALVGIFAFAAVIFSGPIGSAALFRFGTLAIGFGGGLFAVGTMLAAMDLADQTDAGFAIGAFSAVQATAIGLGLAIGGITRDVVNMLALDGSLGAALTTASTGYNVVYNIEIVLLFMSLVVLGPLAGKRFAGGRDGLRQFGLADLPG